MSSCRGRVRLRNPALPTSPQLFLSASYPTLCTNPHCQPLRWKHTEQDRPCLTGLPIRYSQESAVKRCGDPGRPDSTPWRRRPRAEKERLRRGEGEGEGREGYLRQREQHGKRLEVQRMRCNAERKEVQELGAWLQVRVGRPAEHTQVMGALATGQGVGSWDAFELGPTQPNSHEASLLASSTSRNPLPRPMAASLHGGQPRALAVFSFFPNHP